jgi:hypothetical protein
MQYTPVSEVKTKIWNKGGIYEWDRKENINYVEDIIRTADLLITQSMEKWLQ